VFRPLTLGLLAVSLAALMGCARDYSPNTYSAAATQQANKVTQGVVVGVRAVAISADGTVGAVTGGAAGGVLGAQVPGSGVGTALGTVGGSLIGGIIGTTVEHAAGDTNGFEYIVRQSNGDLISVTQKEATALAIGQKVLVIAGNQARIVADYSVPGEAPNAAAAKDEKKDEKKETTASKEAPAKDTPAKDEPAATDAPPAPQHAAVPAETLPAGPTASSGATPLPAPPPPDPPAAPATDSALARDPAAAPATPVETPAP
jgi:outer membrane lipoprotein SlyB